MCPPPSWSVLRSAFPAGWPLLFLLLLLLTASPPAFTADPSELEARLAALERQNAELFEQLSQSQVLPPPVSADSSGWHAPAESTATLPAHVPPAPQVFAAAPGFSRLDEVFEPVTPAAAWQSSTSSSSAAPKPPDPLSLSARWNHGLELQSSDKKFRVHVGGRTQVDMIFLQDNPAGFTAVGGLGDGDSVNMRRGRFRIDGTMFEIIDFACEYDFVNEANVDPLFGMVEANLQAVPAVTDMWLNVKHVPLVGNVKMGVFKEPIGFDHLHSSRWLNFLERSFNQDAFNGPFNNGFSPGVMIWDTFDDEYGTWATGVFKNATNIFAWGVGDGEYAWTSRLTYLPYYDECSQGANLLHLGIAWSLRDPNNSISRYRSRGSLRNGPPGPQNPVFAETGLFFADSNDLLALELSWQWGPLQVNAEYEANFNPRAFGNGLTAPAGLPLGTVVFQGWYVEGLYFLTGEHRDYDRKAAVYGRVIPHHNFNWGQGAGAWQIGLRYAQLDLQDSGMNGGVLQDVTLGLNWFLNPNLKLQWNYVYMHRATSLAPDANIHGAGMRLAFDF